MPTATAPTTHSRLAQRNSKTRYGGRLYVASRRFSAGAYPDPAARRERETTRVTKEWHHDGDGWQESWQVETDPGRPAPYGLVNSSKSSTFLPDGTPVTSTYKRKKADTRGIPGVAKRRIANMVCCLYRDYGRENVGFATLTIPPLPPADMARVNENYGRLNQRALEKLKRKVERRGGEWLAVAAYEIQEKRLEKWGQIALHTHVVYLARPHQRSDWWLKTSDWEKAWGDTLDEFLGRPVPRHAMTNVQKAKADLAFELAKYQTKGSQVIKAVNDQGRGSELPGQWWSASRALKQLDRENTHKLTGDEVEYLMSYHQQLQEMGQLRARPILISYETREIQIGIAGFFVNDAALEAFMVDRPRPTVAPVKPIGTTPTRSRLEDAMVAALAAGDVATVERLVDQMDVLYPDQATAAARDRETGQQLFEQTCREVERRRSQMTPTPTTATPPQSAATA